MVAVAAANPLRAAHQHQYSATYHKCMMCGAGYLTLLLLLFINSSTDLLHTVLVLYFTVAIRHYQTLYVKKIFFVYDDDNMLTASQVCTHMKDYHVVSIAFRVR